MPHLSPETLARIADGPATDTEVAHLDACAACREELERMREQIDALGRLPDLDPPSDLWTRVEAGLDAPRGRSNRPAAWLRAAAAIAVFAVGTASGWALRGSPAAESDPPDFVDRAEPAGIVEATSDPATRLRSAEQEYVRAVDAYLRAHPEASPATVVPYERMAALQGIALTARAALEQAPEDPVIGQYYRSAMSQQQAMMSNVDVPVSTESDPWF